MAQVLNKDPITYQRERDGFLRELQIFHESRGTPFRRVPQINGQEVDLYLLYVLVTAHGGWLKVNSRSEWDDLLEQFRLPQRCVNSGVALKQIYLRYLDRYEKVNFLGNDDGRGSDDDDDSRHKRLSARALHAVPLSYNTYQHMLSETQRAFHGLSTNLYKPSDYDRLAMSLMSPLPNEQDFAINVCTLLSNEGKHTLKLDKCPRLVDFLLAHAAVFNTVGTRELFQDVYGKVRQSSVKHFWADVLQDPELNHLADETRWPLKRSSLIKLSLRTDSANKIDKDRLSSRLASNSDSELDLDCEMDVDLRDILLRRRKFGESSKTDTGRIKRPRIDIEPSDLELFCLGRAMGTQDYLGQRVIQVATILRNLSFGEENQAVLAKNQTFIRFLLLCVNARWDNLKQLGLDTLGNIATELQLERLSSDSLLSLILTGVTQRLFGQDRAGIIAALEVLNKLGQREDNEDAIQRSLDGKVFEQICRYLTLHDIMLLVQTLECLYSLSSLGEKACNCIVRVHGAVDTLVSLVTVEAQSYGPKACILMRVVETISGHEGAVPGSHLTVLQPASQTHHPEHSQAGHSGTVGVSSGSHSGQHMGPTAIKKVYPPSPMISKTVPIRPAFGSSHGTASPVVTLHPQLALQQQNPHQQTMFPPSSHSASSLLNQANVSSAQPQAHQVSQPAGQMMSVIAQAPPLSTPASVIQHPPSAQSPQPHQLRNTATPPIAPAPSQGVPAQLSAQELVVRENEQFAASFLQATYEGMPGFKVEQSEVYNKYLSACAKAGRKGVIAPLHFPKIVRSVYGVSTVPVVKPVMLAGDSTPSGVSKQHFYEGIKVRPKPLPMQMEGIDPVATGISPVEKKRPPTKSKKASASTAGSAPIVSSTSSDKSADPSSQTSVSSSSTPSFTPSSSILLSQLSAPPKPKDTPSTPEIGNQVSIAHTTLVGPEASTTGGSNSTPTSTNSAAQPAMLGVPPSNTSLIKSLLATKVGETCIAGQQTVGMMSGSITSHNIDSTQQVAQRQRMQLQQQQQPPPQLTAQSSVDIQGQAIPISSAPSQTQAPQLSVQQQSTHQSQLPQLQPQQTQPQSDSQSPNPTQASSVAASTALQTQQTSQSALLQQQLIQVSNQTAEQMAGTIIASTIVNHKGKPMRVARINGARAPAIIQIPNQVDTSDVENHIGGTVLQNRRDPPQPPPPPLAPLSSGSNRIVTQDATESSSVIKCTNNVIVPEENSTKVVNPGTDVVLVNGAAHIGIKTEIKEEVVEEETKPVSKGNLMLVDLLEKSVDVKEPPVLNGGLSSKDLCISERGLELVSKTSKTDLGKQIRITERGIEVVDAITGGCEKELTGMELRLTERGLELVDKQSEATQPAPSVQQDNVLQKELSVGEKLLEFLEKQDGNLEGEVLVGPEGDIAPCVKRPAENNPDDKSDIKRLCLEVNGNGSNSGDESGQGEEKVKASSAAANLYSALAASVLEDEDPELLMEQVPKTHVPAQLSVKEEPVETIVQPQIQSVEMPVLAPQPPPPQLQLVQSGGTLRQVYVSSDPNQSAPPQQMVMAGTRQIIVSQAVTGQNPVFITTGGSIALQGGTGATGTTTLKTASGQTVPVLMQTNASGNVLAGAMARPAQYVVSNQGQQLQLVQSGNQIQLASSSVGGHQFVMAQPQTALIQGQPQTVLVAQTPQQQGTSAKTIIILQQQPGGGVSAVPMGTVATAPQAVQQKLVAVTPQGQQVMVTPVQRPVIQAGTASHAAPQPPALVVTGQHISPAPSPALPATASVSALTGIPTPVLTANPAPAQTPPPTTTPPIPTPTITANPNASAAPRPNVVRPSPAPSPNSTVATSKANGVVSNVQGAQARVGTRSSIAKPGSHTTITTATAVPGGSATASTVNSIVPKPTAMATNAASRVGGMPSPAPRPMPIQSMFLCEWRGCMRSFKSANEVYMHACEAHCPSGSQEIQCLWERCDGMKRKRFSLMTHLFDRHCNADVLRMMAMRRRQLSQSGRSEIPPPQPPPPHPGYAPNAAFHAIKRHALEFVNPKELLHKPGPAPVPVPPEQDDNEGPVTKSIRLTAALILRNLVIYSNSGRRMLRSHEPHLASVALSNVESSRTVAQVLYDMNHASNR